VLIVCETETLRDAIDMPASTIHLPTDMEQDDDDDEDSMIGFRRLDSIDEDAQHEPTVLVAVRGVFFSAVDFFSNNQILMCGGGSWN
jgi:hypothetical protein